MSEKTINDEEIAKEAIASSPDVTEGIEHDAPEPAPKEKAANKAVVVIDETRAQKDAEILERGFSNTYEQFSGGDKFNEDQKYMLSAFGRELFGYIQTANVPQVARIAILGVCCTIPFIPLILKMKNGDD